MDPLEEVRKAKEELLAKMKELEDQERELEKVRAVVVDLFSLTKEAGVFSFRTSPYREDVVNAIRPYRTWDALRKLNVAQVQNYNKLKEVLSSLPNISWNISPDIEESIIKWTPIPDIQISSNKLEFIVKYNKPQARFICEHIRGSRNITTQSNWKVPISRALELWNAISTSPYTHEWEPETHDLCERILNKNKKLNEIAHKEKPDESLQDFLSLNGHSLLDFQGVTLEFAIEADFRMLIQHEMGLGKTPCALAVAEYMRIMYEKEGKKFSCIIIVPAMANPNWRVQIKKFTNLSAFNLSGSKPGPGDIEPLYKKQYPYFLINYDPISDSFVDEVEKEWDDKLGMYRERKITGSTWVKLINMCDPDLIIMDEAHYLKNSSSKRSQAMMGLNTDGKGVLLLTGTSITNRPNDLHTLIYLIDKDVAGSRESFINRYFDKYTGVRNSAELREILKPIAFRKTKAEVLKELPPIRRITKNYTISAGARKRYEMVLSGLFAEMNEHGEFTNQQIISSVLTELLRCKQIVAEDKIPFTVDLAKEIVENTDEGNKYDKCIIFSQFIPTCKQIYHELGGEENCILITGADNPEKRFKLIEEFQTNPKLKYCVGSLHAMSESLNVTAAGYVIFNDLWWTAHIHRQAEGRAYGRLNDPHSIDAYYIVSENTIEDYIWEMLEAKLRIFKEVVEDAEAERETTILKGVLSMLREMKRMM